ncbi:hypothetical protein D3C80_906980 [compost metagenome]
MGLIGRVDQLDPVTVIEVACLLVVDVGQERQVRLRVHRRRRRFRFASTPRVGVDARSSQRFDDLATQSLELRIRDEIRLWRIQLNGRCVVLGGAQLTEQVVQLLQRLLWLVGHPERTVEDDAGTDALFAGGRQLQTLFTQAGNPRQANAALG